MGELTKKDNSLCFRKDSKNVYIPVENTKEIFCFNEVSINTKLLDFLSQNNIIIHFYNYYASSPLDFTFASISATALSNFP